METLTIITNTLTGAIVISYIIAFKRDINELWRYSGKWKNIRKMNLFNKLIKFTMANEEKVKRICEVLKAYYAEHPNESKRPALEFMDLFVQHGIFNCDSKSRPGLPLRKLMRDLDDRNECNQIPYLIVDRKIVNRNWYFAPTTNADSHD